MRIVAIGGGEDHISPLIPKEKPRGVFPLLLRKRGMLNDEAHLFLFFFSYYLPQRSEECSFREQ